MCYFLRHGVYVFIHHEGSPVQYMQEYKTDNYKKNRQSN